MKPSLCTNRLVSTYLHMSPYFVIFMKRNQKMGRKQTAQILLVNNTKVKQKWVY